MGQHLCRHREFFAARDVRNNTILTFTPRNNDQGALHPAALTAATPAAPKVKVMGDIALVESSANVIAFRRTTKSTRAAAPVELHAGQILFFTGVRYERMAESDGGPHREDGSSATRKKRRRA